MSERKEQFDVFIGGSLHLPHALDVRGYANARLQEIQALSEAIDNPQRTGLAFQQLPKHMRRRMMAHESKRLPRAVREAHRRQFEKSGLPPPSKKPSRKHRRRPKNLLTEYNRRQKEFAWLETHIWHAKRFYMVKKWGYNLANAPNNKGFRASYRASSKHCLLQDVSYLSCIELRGPFNQLIEGFRFHTSEECGLTFGANCFKDGASEGSVALYRHGMYPNGAIGNVSFLWKPDDKINRGSSRTIWIWIHPAFYQEVLDEFIGTFSLKLVRSMEVIVSETYFTTSTSEMDVDNDSVPPRKKKPRLDKKVEEKKIETRNIPFSRTPKYQNDSGLEMVLLKDTLNRFRLTGPLSQAVLFEGLQIANMAEKTVAKDQRKVTKTKPIKKATGNIDEIFAQILEAAKEESSSEDEVMFFNKDTAQGAEEVKMSDWWTEFYNKNFVFRAWLKDQNEYWQSLGGVKTPAQLPPNIVIGLTIRDPRLCMPSRRKKAVPDEKVFTCAHYFAHVTYDASFVIDGNAWACPCEFGKSREIFGSTCFLKEIFELSRYREQQIGSGKCVPFGYNVVDFPARGNFHIDTTNKYPFLEPKPEPVNTAVSVGQLLGSTEVATSLPQYRRPSYRQ